MHSNTGHFLAHQSLKFCVWGDWHTDGLLIWTADYNYSPPLNFCSNAFPLKLMRQDVERSFFQGNYFLIPNCPQEYLRKRLLWCMHGFAVNLSYVFFKREKCQNTNQNINEDNTCFFLFPKCQLRNSPLVWLTSSPPGNSMGLANIKTFHVLYKLIRHAEEKLRSSFLWLLDSEFCFHSCSLSSVPIQAWNRLFWFLQNK